MNRFTKELRQEIVREFAVRHNGTFNPGLFLEEVRSAGQGHPAYEWFEWDQAEAARRHQLEQAREFARDLRVVFKIEEVGGRKPVKVRETVMPMLLSPLRDRQQGGGYYLVDPDDPAHMREHCAQAAVALRGWLNRYIGAMQFVKMPVAEVEGIVSALEAVSTKADAA